MLTGPLPKQVDYRKLAEEKSQLEGTIPLVMFPRLGELIANPDGDVQVRLKFRRGKKHRTLVLGEFSASPEMICQNCLEPVTCPINSTIRIQLVENFDALVSLEQDEDGIVCESQNVSLVDLLEDELIVSLPMVPKHAAGECTIGGPEATRQASVEEAPSDTYKPFAGLAKLTEELKRS